MRLNAVCLFLKRKGPWLLAIAPAVLVGIQAISPSAAAAIQRVIHVLATQQ